MFKPSRIASATISGMIGVAWLATGAGSGSTAVSAAAPSAPPAGWKLVWSDEFDGKEIDPAKWDFDNGNFLQAGEEKIPGWGNGELEFYTRRPKNIYLKDGMLHLRAVRENYQGCPFTSARLNSRNLFSKRYGRFDFRAKLPTGKGVWPAIWMRPQDLGNPDADTKFPVEMVVDYVRVYDPIEAYPPAGPRGPGKFPFSK